MRKIPGVLDTEVGYAGGKTDNPTYEDIKTGRTGHAESLKLVFDSSVVGYEAILDALVAILGALGAVLGPSWGPPGRTPR